MATRCLETFHIVSLGQTTLQSVSGRNREIHVTCDMWLRGVKKDEEPEGT